MFYEIFTNLCAEKNISPTATLQSLKISTSKLTAWKNGSLPSASVLILLSEFFQTSIDYLLKGESKSSSTVNLTADEHELLQYFKKLSDKSKGIVLGRAEQLAELETPVAKEPEPEQEQETIFIEYSTLKVSAGTGEPLIDDTYHDFLKVKRNDLTEEANFAVQISGNSMLPRFKDKEWVLVRSQPDVEIGEIGIFIIDGNGYIKERAADRLVSINPEYDDIYFKENQDIKCKGLVIGTLESNDFV